MFLVLATFINSIIYSRGFMDAESIAQRARKSISDFCHEECKSYCCRKGYLVMDAKEAGLLTGDRVSEFEADSTLKKTKDGRYSLFLGSLSKPCPRLKDYKCTIHSNPGRPSACRKFPVFVEGNKVRLSHRCLAVKNGRFYPFIKEWMAIGCSVQESDPMYDSEFYEADIEK